AGGAAVQQAHELGVDRVDALAQRLDVRLPPRGGRLQLALFSHRTRPARSPSGFSSRKRTSALPTTTPSAAAPPSRTWAGVETPKPRITGSPVSRFSRSTRGRASSDRRSRSPVTPVRLIA